ncbi:EAL domain-containing protein [Aliarcobacter butzleri]|uniref:EAL domain-containing protein n=2 Tax=Aliarcobacter butzleri TaxID=28197 RepID=UPI001EDAFF28|nr:bifunctional diguanylate cyclase/phosphodiesterase [Aliarcobacter butzleri]MCG3672043.1 bifunctional diguanylate cyclase/phosphodiesterase [Aliarcobacter butzleri]MCG3690196.1 bifunctional diguanylate cyclase/phosphodiesterase [Aliarcobacter butzleri]
MNCDVFVINENLKFDELKKDFSNRLKDINIHIFSTFNNILDEIDSVDIIIVNFDLFEKFKKIKKFLKNSVEIIYISNNDKIKVLKNGTNINYIYINDNNKLCSIIENSLSKKDLKEEIIKEDFYESFINNINCPIFVISKNNLIFSNNHFYKLLDICCIEELNKKYKSINNLFQIEKDCITNLDEITENSKVCIKDVYQNKKFFSIQKIFLSTKDINIIILTDISHVIEHRIELQKLLYIDNLTKLPNRTKLIEDLQNNLLHIKAIALFNINSFKEINDFFGHKVGDIILNDVSKLISQLIENDNKLKLYKFPGDIYCISTTDESKENFIELVKKILESIDKNVLIYEHNEIYIRMCAGISFSDKNNKLITADIALQGAKKDHKDYLVFFEKLDKLHEYENNMLWTKKLKTAFLNDKITVYFQPIIDNKTLKVDKYECLVRLIDEEGKVISPFFFLEVAKKSGQYSKLTRTVIKKSFETFENLPFEFSLNISYKDIIEPDFLEFIKTMLNKHKVTNRVVFEILEDESIKNYDLLINFIEEIKTLGCKVAIDDFGTGYSNFEHLLKMNVNYLKIDASLIKNITKDENSRKITKTIVEFAKSLNLKTIAEFVENKEIFDMANSLGVDYSQGYYFSAPIEKPNINEF